MIWFYERENQCWLSSFGLSIWNNIVAIYGVNLTDLKRFDRDEIGKLWVWFMSILRYLLDNQLKILSKNWDFYPECRGKFWTRNTNLEVIRISTVFEVMRLPWKNALGMDTKEKTCKNWTVQWLKVWEMRNSRGDQVTVELRKEPREGEVSATCCWYTAWDPH